MKRLPAALVTALLVLTASANHLPGATIASNLDQPTGGTEIVTPSTFVASSFSTGSSASMLASVQLLLQVAGQPDPIVDLYSDNNGQPGSDLGSLLSPNSYANGSNPLLATFGGNLLSLAADSTYWIVAKAGAGPYQWAYSSTSVGSGPGFQPTWAISYQEDTNWFPSDILPMQMRVQDTPEPGSLVLLALGFAVIGSVLLRRSQQA